MNILQVIPYYAPAWSFGGTVKVAYEISTRLVKRGHRVTVFSSDFLDPYSRVNYDSHTRVVKGVKVHYFKNLSLLFYRITRLSITPVLIKYAKSEIKNFEVVHLHQYRSFQNIICIHYAKKYNIPCILQAHGSIARVVEKQRLKKLFDVFFGFGILRDVNKVLALTKTEAEKCMRMGVNEEQIEIIPNGIDLSEYSSMPERGVFREKHSIKDNEKVILYLGRIHISKGLDLLMRAFADLLNELKDVKIVLIGPDDRYLSELNKIITSLGIKEMVRYIGFVSEKEKLAAYVDADVFVTPSFYGFPITFLEAMACGVPIITTNKGDFIEGIDNEIGFVVRYDKRELKNALFNILTDEELRLRFRRNCREKIREYDWKVIVNKIEEIYSSVVKRGDKIC